MIKGLKALKEIKDFAKNEWEDERFDFDIIEKELKIKDVLLKLILQFFDDELKENFKNICASDINLEIGKETFTEEEINLLKEVLL